MAEGRARARWKVRQDDVSLAVVVNGLVNSVTVIKAAARLLEGYWPNLSDTDRANMLTDITRHADLIAGVLADVAAGLPPAHFDVIDLSEEADREGGEPTEA